MSTPPRRGARVGGPALPIHQVQEIIRHREPRRVSNDNCDVFPGIAKVDDRLVILIDPVALVAELGITRVEVAA